MNCLRHEWTRWSAVFRIADYFAQSRTCVHCNHTEIKEVRIK
jgi:hypothetical protein